MLLNDTVYVDPNYLNFLKDPRYKFVEIPSMLLLDLVAVS